MGESVSDTVELMSPKRGLIVTLEPSHVEYDPRVGTRIVQRAKQLRFVNGRCTVPADWMPLVEESAAWNGGRNTPRTVWLADDTLEEGPVGPGITRGAITAPARHSDNPPTPDWDDLGARVISEKIAEGVVTDLLGAVAWESSHKKRKTVLQALAARLADGEVDEPVSEPIAESFEAEAA